MTKPLELERFKALLAAYGARPERFPDRERDAALALLESSEEARSLARAESALDDVFAHPPGVELSPGLARKLAELPIRHARPERRSHLVALGSALGWAAAVAFGIVWGARSEALESATSGDIAAETATPGGSGDELLEDDAELVELALGVVPQLEE
jgi:ferric-dicitrate binding protein FerR (iron transport regulator)